jgi:hypothetical protein
VVALVRLHRLEASASGEGGASQEGASEMAVKLPLFVSSARHPLIATVTASD